MSGVLWTAPIRHFGSIAIIPASPLSRFDASRTQRIAALSAGVSFSINEHIVLDNTSRTATSPNPVTVAAPERLSAYSPHPICGVSPIRPGSLSIMPPVEAAAAKLPSSSTATAPTVSEETASGYSRMSAEFFLSRDTLRSVLLFLSCKKSLRLAEVIGLIFGS